MKSRFGRTEHAWAGGTQEIRYDPVTSEESKVYINRRCTYCGANERDYQRGDELETHAYALIHTDDPQTLISQLFGAHMQFDVIVGNPPYHLGTEGHGKQARPIYQQFIEQAKRLDPKFLTMVIPSRWFSGGMGLDDFRAEMLGDQRLRSIDDFLNASDVFGGIGLKGGVCYFLWNRDTPGLCDVTTHRSGMPPSKATRPLLEQGVEIFIRFNEGVSVLRKVAAVEGSDDISLPPSRRFMNLVSPIGAFGLDSTFRGRETGKAGDLKVYRNGGVGYISREEISRHTDAIDRWKVFIGSSQMTVGDGAGFWTGLVT